MSTAPAKVAEYAPKDDTLAGLLEHHWVQLACRTAGSNVEPDTALRLVTRLDAIRSRIVRRSEDLFLMSMRAEMRALEELERHDADAEGAIREVTAAATEAHDAVIKLRTDIRLSGTDPEAHPTDELARATMALSEANAHTINVERDLNARRATLEAAWATAARQMVQDGVLLFGAIGDEAEHIRATVRVPAPMFDPMPANLRHVGDMWSDYPLPVLELREITHREKPREGYAAGAAS